jgi:alpha-mannosidase
MKPLSYEVVHVFESDTSPIPVENSSSCRLENEHFAVFLGESGICAEEKRTHKVFPSFLSFEYEHDIGDTYSFSATPEGKIWHSQLEDASLNALFPDEMVLRYSLQIPSHYGQNRDSFELKNLEVIVRLRLAASGAIDLVFSYENHAHNGRLRAIFSTGTLVQKFIADGHFRLAEREMEALRAPERSPYPGETQYDTHHQGDFSFVETDKDYRVWVANRGNPEISLVEREGQSFFALTLHRSVGYLSVFGGSIRKCQAGPEVPTPEAQCLRAFVHEVSWGAGLLPRETVMQKALTFSHPLYVSEMPFLPYVNAGTVPRQASFMEFDNPSVVLSALRPLPEKGCALRFYNVSSVPQNLTVRLGIPVSCWAESSLDEIWSAESQRSIENNSITVTILPHEIRTLLLQ